VAELKALGEDEARLLGLRQVSERTLKRLAAAWRGTGIAGCVDGRWLLLGNGHLSIGEEIREAISRFRAESLHRCRMSLVLSLDPAARGLIVKWSAPDSQAALRTVHRTRWRWGVRVPRPDVNNSSDATHKVVRLRVRAQQWLCAALSPGPGCYPLSLRAGV
jgi:hypothetical protein